MDYLSVTIIAFLFFLIFILLMIPPLMNVPLYRYIKAKLTHSMIIFLLRPDKRIDMVLARPRGSVIETKKGNLHFLNVPDAIYTLFGIPTALAYHKYGAILPAQNIIHATEMRERGYKNIGEVEKAIKALNFLLEGDKKNPGLYAKRDELLALEEKYEKKKKKKDRDKSSDKSKDMNIIKANIDVDDEEDEETELVKRRLEKVNNEIKAAETELFNLENILVSERGFIKIQDIFNFLNRNLSTDVIFSIIERSVAEEMRGMRDLASKFVQLFPFILTLLIIFILGIIIIITIGKGGVSMPSIIPQI